MYKLVWIISFCFFIFILWIIYLADTGTNSILFDWVKMIPYGDKFGHFFLFGILTLAANLSFRLKSYWLGNYRLYWGTIAVSIFVVIEELSQFFFPSRTLDASDLMADCLGILFFTYITRLMAKNLSDKIYSLKHGQ